MTNEQIVEEIRNGYSVTNNMQLLYENNLPLIKQIIKPYSAYEPMEDLLQEAYFGLWEAVQHYETMENVLFMTYARYWIKQSAQRYIENCGSIVKLPSHVRQEIIRYKKTVEELSQSYQRTPTIQEIADNMLTSVPEVQNIKAYMQGVASIDAPVTDDNELTLSDSIQADICIENDIIDEMYAKYSNNELWGIVECHTSKIENDIIVDRYKNHMTYRDIGIKHNVSMQRAREIEHSALRKLSRGKAKRKLFEKFEVIDSGIYYSGYNNFRLHDFTSNVERIALKKAELIEEYKSKIMNLERMNYI